MVSVCPVLVCILPTGFQTNADERRRTQTHTDERKANCVQCVGRRNLKTRPDAGRLFKGFQNALYHQE